MPSSFLGITTMSSALKAFQTQLDVTGGNIANSETAGYNRRTVSLDQGPGIAVTVGATISLGQGVNVSAVTRVRDMFLAARRTETTSKLGRANESLTGLSKIQSAMAEPGDMGVSSAFDGLVNAFSALSASPNDISAKGNVQQAGQLLSDRVSTFSKDLNAQQADNLTRSKDVLSQIDQQTSKIAELNKQIIEATARGATPNDLMDARDTAVSTLAGLADVTVAKSATGYDVSLNGFTLVNPSGATEISSKYDFSSGKIVNGTDTFPVNGGALAGTHDVAASLTSTMGQLNTFADNVRTEFNALFTTGTTAAGVTGKPFFAEPVPPATSITADGLQLDANIAADPNNIPAGTSGLSGDGTLAAQISALRDKKVAGLGNNTMSGFYSNLVSDVGRQVSSTQDTVNVQTSVASQIDAQISETSGVSMDDEMANLLRFQRAYQAAAKALSTFDEMTQTIINMLNR